jgi:hypothetical protein
MNVEHACEAIDRYVDVRMEQGRERARERFLAYIYLKHGGDEVRELFRKTRGLATYYVHYFKFLENPFKGPEFAWFASMLTVAIYGVFMMFDEDMQLPGICIISGTIVHGLALLKMVADKWREAGVMAAIYRELVELSELELQGA